MPIIKKHQLDLIRSAIADPELDSDLDQDRSTDPRFNLSIRAESINEKDRSVEVILATENRVEVYDYQNYRVIEEVLLMDGMELVDHLPMLNDHKRWSLDEVFGSVTGFKIVGGKLKCRFQFADLSELENDDEAKRIERAWLKVKQGHLKGVSVGYRVKKFETIEPGQSKTVRGKVYTAGDLALRVVTKWKPKEGSLTVVQADDQSHIRKEFEQMNKKLFNYLVSQGFRKDGTHGEAWKFFATLEGQKRSDGEALIDAKDAVPADFVRSDIQPTKPTKPATESDESGTRSDNVPTTPTTTTPATPTTPNGESVRSVVDEAIRAERQRVSEVQSMFRSSGIDNPDLMQRAINENWTPQQTAAELLPMVRSHYQSNGENYGTAGGHVGIHSVRQADVTGLSAALMLRQGVSLDHKVFESSYAMRSEMPSDLRGSINSERRQQALEMAHRFDDLSLVDICRMALQISGHSPKSNRTEMIRQAISSGAVNAIFTTNVSAQLLASYMDTEDTTVSWTTESEVQNFQSNERHTMGKTGALTRHGRGGTADHMDIDSSFEEYKIARYSGQMFTDEQDIIDDRLGALDGTTPTEMGLAARQLRPDLVYASLFANATLNATSTALFDAATHKNLFTGVGTVLSLASLSAAVTAIQKQRIRNRPLNLALKYVMVPADLKLTLYQLLNSMEIRESASANGTMNPLRALGLQPVSDDRLGVAGVTDPVTGIKYTGTATNWFAACQPGSNGAKTIEVGYLRGTGKAPRLSTWVEDRGKWGIGHAVAMDIGSKPLDFRALQKHAGS